MELACLLPVVVVVLLLAVQVGLVVRDRVLAVHAARAAGRAVIVDPTSGAARAALDRQGPPVDSAALSLVGDRSPGGLVTVIVRIRPTRVPLVGRVVSTMVIEERLVVMVEGPS